MVDLLRWWFNPPKDRSGRVLCVGDVVYEPEKTTTGTAYNYYRVRFNHLCWVGQRGSWDEHLKATCLTANRPIWNVKNMWRNEYA